MQSAHPHFISLSPLRAGVRWLPARSFHTPTRGSNHASLLFLNPATPACAALSVSRRHQRTTSARPRTSTWSEKARKYDQERKHAARVRASASSSGDDGGWVRTGKVEPQRPERNLRQYFFGNGSGKMPLNPLHLISKSASDPANKHDPDARATGRMLAALQELQGKQLKKGADPVTLQFSEEERRDIVNRYIETRWFASIYRPFRDLSDNKLKWVKRLCNLGIAILGAMLYAMMMWVYYREMKAVSLLIEEDRKDYVHMVMGMRYSDLHKLAMEVLHKEDPLEALPDHLRYHMVVEAGRERGWHITDWETELRKMHPASAMEELDWLHCFYWAVLYVGGMTTGGGAVFSERFADLTKVREKELEREASYVDIGPATKEESRRGFFS